MTENEDKDMKVGLEKIPKAITVWAIVVVAAIAAMYGYVVGINVGERGGQRIAESHQELEITKVIIANTDIINTIGQLANQVRQNSDIIMRYHHHLDGHDPSVKKVFLCPECWTEEDTPAEVSKYFVTEFEDHPEEVPETFEQLLEDCKEIETSIKAAKSSLSGQSVTLQRILDKLRTQNEGNKQWEIL